jgi:hypothetical protein
MIALYKGKKPTLRLYVYGKFFLVVRIIKIIAQRELLHIGSFG